MEQNSKIIGRGFLGISLKIKVLTPLEETNRKVTKLHKTKAIFVCQTDYDLSPFRLPCPFPIL